MTFVSENPLVWLLSFSKNLKADFIEDMIQYLRFFKTGGQWKTEFWTKC